MNYSDLVKNKYIPTNLYFKFSHFIFFILISIIGFGIIKTIKKEWTPKNTNIKDGFKYSIKELTLLFIILCTLYVFANYSITFFGDSIDYKNQNFALNFNTFLKITIILTFVGTIIISNIISDRENNKEYWVWFDISIAGFAIIYSIFYLIFSKIYLYSSTYNPSSFFGYIFIGFVIIHLAFLIGYYKFKIKNNYNLYKQYVPLIYFFISLLFRSDGYDVFNSIRKRDIEQGNIITSSYDSFDLVYKQTEESKIFVYATKFINQFFTGICWGRIVDSSTRLYPFDDNKK